MRIDELAIFGGTPAFEDKLHVGRPNIGDRARLLERINTIIDTRWLTNAGPFEQELERRISEFVGVEHCVAMSNGTVALEIAIQAIGMTGEVIIPSFTFVATAHALQWQAITPVFCDIDRETHCLDPRSVEAMITPHTSGILGVHLWGRSCDVGALREIADRHKLKLLFDAAHAFGCTYQGRMIGNFGDAEVFSFHATKFFNTFEGGAVTTNNDALAARIRLMKNFGFSDYDEVITIGTNGKMSEVSAAMGLTNLESMGHFIEINRRNYEQYRAELTDLEGIHLLVQDEKEKSNYQYIVLEVDKRKTIVTRDQLMEIFHRENVWARRYFYPGCHRMEPYRSCFPDAGLVLPETDRLTEQVMSLPTGMTIGSSEITKICQIIRLVVANGREVSERLHANQMLAQTI